MGRAGDGRRRRASRRGAGRRAARSLRRRAARRLQEAAPDRVRRGAPPERRQQGRDGRPPRAVRRLMETLAALLDATAAADPAAEAIAYAPRGEVTVRSTWGELAAASRMAARRLLAVGVTKGIRVALLCSNRPEWLPIAFGVARLGGILVPLSTLWKREELRYALAHADVAVLVTLPGFLRHD